MAEILKGKQTIYFTVDIYVSTRASSLFVSESLSIFQDVGGYHYVILRKRKKKNDKGPSFLTFLSSNLYYYTSGLLSK